MSPRKATGALFVLTVIFRISYLFIYPPHGTDHEMLHTAVQNLLSGNGLGFYVSNPANLSEIHFRYMNEWPPLAAWMLSIAKAMTGSAFAADMLLLGFGTLLLLVVLRALMQVLQLKPHAQSLLWLVVLSNPEPFRNLGITDLYGSLFLLWGVLLCIRTLQAPALRNRQLVVAGLFFFLPAAFRYQYYPLVLLFPLFLLVAARLQQNRLQVRQAWLAASVVFFLLAAQITFLIQQAGAPAYMAPDARGFYPENLVLAYPFLLKAFANVSYFENLMVAHIGGWLLLVYYALVYFVSMFLCTQLLLHIIRRMRTAAQLKNNEAVVHHTIHLVLMGTALGVVLLLSALSLVYDQQRSPASPLGFTYVKEGRYFSAACLLLLLLTARLLQQRSMPPFRLPQWTLLRLPRPYRWALAGLFVLNLSLFGKFLVNAATQPASAFQANWKPERKEVESVINTLQNKYDLPVVVAAAHKYFNFQSLGSNTGALQNYRDLLSSGIRTSNPVQLVLITGKQLSDEELKFVYQKQAVQVYSGKRTRVFHVLAGSESQLAGR